MAERCSAQMPRHIRLPYAPDRCRYITLPSERIEFKNRTDQQADEADRAAYQAIHVAVKTGHIRGFFSEVVVTLDAIGRKAKAGVLGAARFVSETTSTGPNEVTISLGPCWKPVDIDPRIRACVETARAMGMRALIGPRALRRQPGRARFRRGLL
jgi:hypothetical protein